MQFLEGWFSGYFQAITQFYITYNFKNNKIKPKSNFVLTQHISEEKLFKSLHKLLGRGYQVVAKFKITPHTSPPPCNRGGGEPTSLARWDWDKILLQNIANYLDCGHYREVSKNYFGTY